ncbi:MAG TPA: DUF6152 family protein [Bryobacteraceae bacterium]|nr:DUF6152 family protein [Bryobacteraceae bacterium]
MNFHFRAVLFGSAFVLTAALPLLAHHSFAAEFDANQPITLKGVVTKVEWMNPHIYFYLDVKDENGKVVNWAAEGAPPNSLYRNGWRKDSLKAGDVITMNAYRAKDGSSTVNVRVVILPDGKSFYAGTADDGGPKGPAAK